MSHQISRGEMLASEEKSLEISASLHVGGKAHLQISETDGPCLLKGQAKGSSKVLRAGNLNFSFSSFASSPGES